MDLESDRSDRAVRRAAAEATRKEAAKSVPETKTSAEEEKRSEKGSSSTQQQLESFAAAVASPSVDDAGSRFYIKREIIVGNVSKFILPGKTTLPVSICLCSYRKRRRKTRPYSEAVHAQMDGVRCRTTAGKVMTGFIIPLLVK